MAGHQTQAGYDLPFFPYPYPHRYYFNTQTDAQHGVENYNHSAYSNQVNSMQLRSFRSHQDTQNNGGYLYPQNTFTQQFGNVSNHNTHEAFAAPIPNYAVNQNSFCDAYSQLSLPADFGQHSDSHGQTEYFDEDGSSTQKSFGPYSNNVHALNGSVGLDGQHPVQQQQYPYSRLNSDMRTVNEQRPRGWNNVGHDGLQTSPSGLTRPSQSLPFRDFQPPFVPEAIEMCSVPHAPMANVRSAAVQQFNSPMDLTTSLETSDFKSHPFYSQPEICSLNTRPDPHLELRLVLPNGLATGLSSDCTTPKSFGDTETTSWISGQTSLLDGSNQAQNPPTIPFSPQDISTSDYKALLGVPNHSLGVSSTLSDPSDHTTSLSITPTNAPPYVSKVAEWNDQPPGTESYNFQQTPWNNGLSNQATGERAQSSVSKDKWPRKSNKKTLPLRPTGVARLAPKSTQAISGAPSLCCATARKTNEVNKSPCKLSKQLKMRGVPNTSIAGGRCSLCQGIENGDTESIYRFLRCTPAKIPPMTFYRRNSTQPFWKDLDLSTGPTEVVEGVTRLSYMGLFSLTQGHGVTLKLPLSKVDPSSVGRLRLATEYPGMFMLPYVVKPSDLNKINQDISDFMRVADDAYFAQMIAQSKGGKPYDGLVHGIFARAKRIAQSATEPGTTASANCHLVANCLRYWTTCRFIEGGWTIVESNELGLPHANDLHHSVPLLSHQLGAVFIGKHLPRLTDEIRKGLNKSLNDRDLLMTNFVAIFVLLHNFSMIMAHQTRFARARKSKFRYTNMPLIRGLHESAKILLTHFHIMTHRQPIFGLDWKPPGGKVKMSPLGPVEEDFRKQLAKGLQNRGQRIRDLTFTDQYHEPLWFAGQLFDSKWREWETPSESPLMETEFLSLPIGPSRPQSSYDTMES